MRARHLGALAAVAALTLSGCGREEDPAATSTTTPMPTVHDTDSSSSDTASSGTGSPSTSGSTNGGSSPSSSVSTEPPEEAQADTKAGAEAFAKWYWQQTGEAAVEGSAAPIRRAASDACSVCEEQAQQTEEKASKYGQLKENPYTVRVVSSRVEGGSTFVKVNVDFEDYEFYKDGDSTALVEGQNYDVVITVDRSGNDWVVANWVLIEGAS